jgi:hypothetical protein
MARPGYYSERTAKSRAEGLFKAYRQGRWEASYYQERQAKERALQRRQAGGTITAAGRQVKWAENLWTVEGLRKFRGEQIEDTTAQQPTTHGVQRPFGPSPSPDWDYYWPTKSTWPGNGRKAPRTLQARFSRDLQRIEVLFPDGTPWHYDDIDEGTWVEFKTTDSPGYMINTDSRFTDWRRYARGGWGDVSEED